MSRLELDSSKCENGSMTFVLHHFEDESSCKNFRHLLKFSTLVKIYQICSPSLWIHFPWKMFPTWT